MGGYSVSFSDIFEFHPDAFYLKEEFKRVDMMMLFLQF